MLDKEPCSLSTSGLRISGALSVRACPEFVCCAIYHAIKIFRSASAKTLPQSSCHLPKPSEASPALPAGSSSLMLTPPGLPRGAVAGFSSPARTCSASSLLLDLPLPSAAAHCFAALRIHLLFSSLRVAPCKHHLSLGRTAANHKIRTLTPLPLSQAIASVCHSAPPSSMIDAVRDDTWLCVFLRHLPVCHFRFPGWRESTSG